MSTTSGVGGTGSILDQYQFGKDREVKGEELGKNEFLELLVAQMNNQNPLEPQENGEFIGQLAQFSTVEGVEKLNSSMETILSGYQSSQALQASSLVGARSSCRPTRRWSTPAKPSKPAWYCQRRAATYSSTSTTAPALRSVASTSGSSRPAMSPSCGTARMPAAKTLPPGTYKFEAQATYDGETKGLYTLLPANVDSVTLGQNGGELMLNLAGIGSIGLSQVQVIGQ